MINKLYKSKIFPLGFQILSLIAFALLISGAWGIDTKDATFAKQLRNTNLSNLIVWSYWWPFIVLSAVFFGRHWCSICPIELISALGSRIGLKKKVPIFIKSGWLITGLYAFVAIVAIHTWGIHRIPQLMAYYLLSLMAIALVTSLVFEKRAFCSYLCPVGKLLGLYSLLSIFGLRVKDQKTCQNCKTKDCISKKNSHKLIGRSCQSDLYPAHITDNRNCILCTQCVKSCPNENIKIGTLKKTYSSFNFNGLNYAEIGMISLLLGFVSYEILSSWKISKSILLAPSNYLFKLLSVNWISPKLFEAIVLFVLIPILILLLIAAISKQIGRKSIGFYLKRITGYLLPILAFGHVFKALLKTSSRIPYWKYAIADNKGIDYAQKIVDKQISLNTSIWIDQLAIVLGIGGLVFALILSLRKLRGDSELRYVNKIIIATLVILYCFLLVSAPLSGII